MNLISLNIIGLGGDVKWNYLKSLIIKEKPGIVCIQETKLISLRSQNCFSLWGSNDIG